MRRLTLQVAMDDLARIHGEPIIQNIESLHVLHVLKQERDEFAVICKISFKGPAPRIEDFFREEGEARLLQRDKDGIGTYFLRGKPLGGVLGGGGYLIGPFEFRDGKATITYVGDPIQVKRFLREVKRRRLPHRVLSIADAKFPFESPLSRLTEKQRKVLIAAYDLGYFDSPKRMNSREIAEKLGIRSSTFTTHRKKAERRLLDEVLLDYLLNQSET
jgi:DNA-binding CsgD family transcriptional regulator